VFKLDTLSPSSSENESLSNW